MIKSNEVIFDHGLGDDFEFERINDLYTEFDKRLSSVDDLESKKYNKSKANLSLLERNHQIIVNLVKHDLLDEQRPLYFYPSSQRCSKTRLRPINYLMRQMRFHCLF